MSVSVRHGAHLGGQIPDRRNENAHLRQGTQLLIFYLRLINVNSISSSSSSSSLGVAQSRDGARRRRLGELALLSFV